MGAIFDEILNISFEISWYFCFLQGHNPSSLRNSNLLHFETVESNLNAVASVLGHHRNLRDYVSHVVGCVVSIVDCFQSVNLSKELVDPNEGGCVSACDVGDLFGGTLHHHHHCSLKALDLEVFLLMRAVLMLFGFRVSISFCKNARFLAVPFSMIEIAC